jgi:hypothetical protein
MTSATAAASQGMFNIKARMFKMITITWLVFIAE